ncbi:MAG: tRNA (adenosine(37)-N6)-threonylcarbamoyltransferase complex transferase subunit TsaD [Chloroflexi bacterium]|nr:tRNA (adenosine(37)-N6)-threonylcarbamoyltransferase complex transferase subunit TsaD [Chloroflexota bacterium]
MTIPKAASPGDVRPVRILAIETSCDETAAAVVDDASHVRSNVVASQIELHQQYGGVFPEMASRAHIEAIAPVIQRAMDNANATWESLSAVAVTKGPGLPGSLVVGVNAAKGICLARDLPLIGVNHLEGHIYSHWLNDGPIARLGDPPFPLLALIVSGGHTELVLVRDHGDYELLGHTVDDAAGEAFDKVARMLGLGYPGGPAIERTARNGNPYRFKFSRPRLDKPFNFSFSGTKTAVMYAIRDFGGSVGSGSDAPRLPARVPVTDLAASFQESVAGWLAEKTVQAAETYAVKGILVGGGVSANQALRERLSAVAGARSSRSFPVLFPPLALCTDNAAMIGAAGHFAYQRGVRDGLDMDVLPDLGF